MVAKRNDDRVSKEQSAFGRLEGRVLQFSSLLALLDTLKGAILGNLYCQNLGDFDSCEFFEFFDTILVVGFPEGLKHRGSVLADIIRDSYPHFHDFVFVFDSVS